MTTGSKGATLAPLHLMPRRTFVQGSAVAVGGATAGLLMAREGRAARPQTWAEWLATKGVGTPAALDAYQPVAFTMAELDTLKAAIDRLIPSDDLGPGASESGVFMYIDRLLGGNSSALLPVYQAGLAALNAGDGGEFVGLDEAAQDELLASVEAGDISDAPAGFFPLMLEHTRQGMFGDPIHGGNREFAGWDLIRYPGVKLVWTEEDQAIGTDVEPEHISVEEYGGQA